MRIDHAAVSAHTLASLPLRVVLVWVAVAFGAVMPVYLQSGFQVLAELGWLALALPFWLLTVAVGSGWCALMAILLLVLLALRMHSFLHEDHNLLDLGSISLLAFAITLRMSGLGFYFQRASSVSPCLNPPLSPETPNSRTRPHPILTSLGPQLFAR